MFHFRSAKCRSCILHGGVIPPSRGWKLVLGGQKKGESLLTFPTRSWNSSTTQPLSFMSSPSPWSFFQIFHSFTPSCPSALNINHATRWVSVILCFCVCTCICIGINRLSSLKDKISKRENLDYFILCYNLITQCLWQSRMWISIIIIII